MPSEVRLENFWILIIKNSKILKKKYAKQSEAKKIWKKLDRAPKCSILGPQNLGSGGARAPGAPPASTSDLPPSPLPHIFNTTKGVTVRLWEYDIDLIMPLNENIQPSMSSLSNLASAFYCTPLIPSEREPFPLSTLVTALLVVSTAKSLRVSCPASLDDQRLAKWNTTFLFEMRKSELSSCHDGI